jgi:hypothetical protein
MPVVVIELTKEQMEDLKRGNAIDLSLEDDSIIVLPPQPKARVILIVNVEDHRPDTLDQLYRDINISLERSGIWKHHCSMKVEKA